jgi:RND family efflux transporter MFP subunit
MRSALSKTRTAGAVILVSLALTGCETEQVATNAPPQPVQVMRVEPRPAVEQWSYTGVVRARYETDQAFRVAGKVIERSVDVGQRVEAGQLIARLDPADLTLALQSQEAELMAAGSSRDQAVADEKRYKILFKKGHVAMAALDQRVATADEARSRVKRAERALELARNQLAYAELRAVQAGTVTALRMEIGQVVGVGQTVARIARLDALEAEVAIPEQMLGAVQSAAAEAEVWDSGALRLPAELRELSPEADPVSRTYAARFALTSPGLDVQLGRTVTVHLAAQAQDRVVELPLAAVVNDGRGAFVWRVDGQGSHALRTPVTVKALAASYVLVTDGLAAGDRVITLGAHMIDEAKPIRIVEQRVSSR